MKGFGKKIIFGIALIICIDVVLLFMIGSEFADKLLLPGIFLLAMKGGIIFWMVLIIRESRHRKEENYRRKNN